MAEPVDKMTSSRPYLIRAMYEWMVDNQMTLHLLVFADRPGVVVPQDHIDDGKIVLNISPSAVRDLIMGNEEITFSGRFSGKPMTVIVPVQCAVGIYTRENGKGMVFSPEDGDPDPENTPATKKGSEKKSANRPSLRVVK
jgi:stringent starvation protein B